MITPRVCRLRYLSSSASAILLVGLIALGCDDDGSASTPPADAHRRDASVQSDASIPDLHGDPAELDGGAKLCAVIRNTCHGFDKGTGDLADRCHDWGHEGHIAVCSEHYDECMAVCSHLDGGGAHDGGSGRNEIDAHGHLGGDASAFIGNSPIELHDHDTLPTVELTITEDSVGGWNLQAALERFRLSPADVNADHVLGVGHMHLFVDGIKYTEVYGPWFYLPELSVGEHEVRVELAANRHNPLTHHGEGIGDTATVVQAPPAGASDAGTIVVGLVDVDGDDAPGIELQMIRNSIGGWDLDVALQDFVLAPESVSEEHVLNQGHLRLYIDGVYRTRLYDRWFYLADLAAGEHTISVRLSTNDHRTYAVGGVPIEAFVNIDGETDVATSASQSSQLQDASVMAP